MVELARFYPEVVRRAHEIVARHKLPEFITGFDVKIQLGSDTPSLVVVYTSKDDYDLETGIILERALEYGESDKKILRDLSDALEGWRPLSVIVSDKDSFNP